MKTATKIKNGHYSYRGWTIEREEESNVGVYYYVVDPQDKCNHTGQTIKEAKKIIDNLID